MSLMEDLKTVAEQQPPGSCGACWELRNMPPEERQAINAAIEGGLPRSRILQALRRNGYDVSEPTFRRHTQNGHTL